MPPPSERIDKWLWMVRIVKTRALATLACRDGNVDVASQLAKPSRDVHVGDTIHFRQGLVTRTLIVRGFPRARVGAKLVPDFCDDRTPPEEFAKARTEPVQRYLGAREKGKGRPTKRERRTIDRLFGGE